MPQICLAFLRFCLSAWVGIGVFFVLVLINLRQSKVFSDEALLEHPRILFPLYYSFEFMLLGTALLCAIACLAHPQFTRGRKATLLALLTAAVGLATWDFAGIYQPLIVMMTKKPLPADFQSLHSLSRSVNGTILALSFIAAWLSLGAGKPSPDEPPNGTASRSS
jgi:hypothetical protein